MIAQYRDAKTLTRRVSPRLFYELQMRRRLRSPDVAPELHILRQLVTGPGASIDVGASEGIYSYVLAGLSRRVHAFECNPDLYRRLVPGNVTVQNVALSHRAGITTLRSQRSRRRTPWARRRRRAFVRYRSRPAFDSFAFADVRLIKIDVEGPEAAVVRAASQTIAAQLPVLIIEIEQRHNSDGLGDVREQLEGPGYTGWFLDGGRLRPIETFMPGNHQNPARSDQPFIHNFMFLPAGMTPLRPLA